jgi:hypothetical protein
MTEITIPALEDLNTSIDNLVHWGQVAAYAIIVAVAILVLCALYKVIRCACCVMSCVTCPCRRALRSKECDDRENLLRYNP